MRREWRLAEEPLHVLANRPIPATWPFNASPKPGRGVAAKSSQGSGVGLFFAREMLKRSGGVPQGLICTAHGGTSMQQWSPDRKHLGGASLYASMLTSIKATGQPVAGILWYQGESDANPKDAARVHGKDEEAGGRLATRFAPAAPPLDDRAACAVFSLSFG
jgi:hypothetical protein